MGSAEYMTAHRNLHLAVLEIAFNATAPDGRPLVASMPLETHKPALEQILRHGQDTGELRQFDVNAMAGLLRSAVTHTMLLAERANPPPGRLRLRKRIRNHLRPRDRCPGPQRPPASTPPGHACDQRYRRGHQGRSHGGPPCITSRMIHTMTAARMNRM